jgi:ribonuclease P protein component
VGAVPEMLRTPREFAALQQSSKSKVHPLLVARYAPNDIDRTRFGFSTGRRLGGAVTRNRVRRRLREAVRALVPRMRPGWDVLIVARPASASATYLALAEGVEHVLRSARLLVDETPDGSPGMGVADPGGSRGAPPRHEANP